MFIRISPGDQIFKLFKAIIEIHRHIEKSIKKIFNRQDFKKTSRTRT